MDHDQSSRFSFSRRSFLKAAGASAAAALAPEIALAEDKTFPTGFKWGAASAAAQVESRVGRGRSNWDVFADISGGIRDGSSNDTNTQFELRYGEELSLLSQAGFNAFRFSFYWSRIQPEGPGAPNIAALDLYDRMIDEMLRLGLDPMATIVHFETPLWAGDFRDRGMVNRAADYADIVTRKFGDRIKLWIAMNEPGTVSTFGYGSGRFAPGYISLNAMGEAIHHQNVAQGLIISTARTNLPKDAKVGTTLNLQTIRAKSGSPEDEKAVRLMDAYSNTAYLDPLFGKEYPDEVRALVAPLIQPGDMENIAAKPDFLGVNYYSRFYVKAEPRSPLGFIQDAPPDNLKLTKYLPYEPDGFSETLLRVHNGYGAPDIYVTEFGFTVEEPNEISGIIEDRTRVEYIKGYLQEAYNAIQKGVRLKGLTYWSSTDNWEWNEGHTKNFGLIKVDFGTQKRTPKRSLEYLGKCSKTNSIV
ncbi:glycoside hydrolase [Ochrobactrum sp. P6BS-III]|uniref:glycoside hydrolase family 1 protein n=1 Tax=unclassified Ochrobactrum TaxID=239106 RepID=UPI000991AAD1|nr:beta-glucosidase [Ochrobactrum sp. P6BSIII]OOL16898.1 glycoside hydrolase [Ochrobactrum sp. P6BS-III]